MKHVFVSKPFLLLSAAGILVGCDTKKIDVPSVSGLTAAPAPVSLSVSPSYGAVALGLTLQLAPAGGTSPYTYVLQSGTGTVSTSGLFQAPSRTETDVIRVTDSVNHFYDATVTVVAGGSDPVVYPQAYGVAVGDPTFSFTVSGGTGSSKFKLVSGPGSINSATGVYTITTAGTALISATDSANKTSNVAKLTVFPKLTLSADLPAIIVKQSAHFTPSGGLTSAAANPPIYTYEVKSGRGTVDQIGNYYASDMKGNPIVWLRDQYGHVAEATMIVADAPSLSPMASEVVVGDAAMTLTRAGGVVAGSGGSTDGTCAFKGDSLGTLDTATCVYTPSAAGTAYVTFSDDSGNTSAAAKIVVNPVLAITGDRPLAMMVGDKDANGINFVATGGMGSATGAEVTYSIVESTDATMTRITARKARLSAGTQAGTVTVRATDSKGHTADLKVVINPALQLSPSKLTLMVDDSKKFSIVGGVVDDGKSPVFKLTAGTGSIDSASGVYQAPSDAGGTATVQVTDTRGHVASASITINEALKVDPATYSLALGNSLEDRYTIKPTGGVLDGSNAYKFTVDDGAIGTVAASGLFQALKVGTAVVTVTDDHAADGLRHTVKMTFTVGPSLKIGLSALSYPSNQDGMVTATGGIPPYHFDRAKSTLAPINPNDVDTMNLDTGRFTPPQSTGNIKFTVKDARGVTLSIDAMIVQPLAEIKTGLIGGMASYHNASGNSAFSAIKFPPDGFVSATGPISSHKYVKKHVAFDAAFEKQTSASNAPRVMLGLNGLAWNAQCDGTQQPEIALLASNIDEKGFDAIIEYVEGGCEGWYKVFNAISYVAVGAPNRNLAAPKKRIVEVVRKAISMDALHDGGWNSKVQMVFAKKYASAPFVMTGFTNLETGTNCNHNGGFATYIYPTGAATTSGIELEYGGRGNDNDGGCGASAIREVVAIVVGEPSDSSLPAPNLTAGIIANDPAKASKITTPVSASFVYAKKSADIEMEGTRSLYSEKLDGVVLFSQGWWSTNAGSGFWRMSPKADDSGSSDAAQSSLKYNFREDSKNYQPYTGYILWKDDGGLPQ